MLEGKTQNRLKAGVFLHSNSEMIEMENSSQKKKKNLGEKSPAMKSIKHWQNELGRPHRNTERCLCPWNQTVDTGETFILTE